MDAVVFEALPTPAVVRDGWQIVKINPAACALAGFRHGEDVRGADVRNLWPGIDWDEIGRHEAQARKTGGPVTALECCPEKEMVLWMRATWIPRPAGQILWCAQNVTAELRAAAGSALKAGAATATPHRPDARIAALVLAGQTVAGIAAAYQLSGSSVLAMLAQFVA